MSLRITGLPAELFHPLFDLSDAELQARGGVRRIAEGGEPCRVSLTDAAPGDELILVNHEHHAVASPYRMRYAIFVRPGETRFEAVDRIPEQLTRRTLAVRAFDNAGMNLTHRLVAGDVLGDTAADLLEDPAAAYLHVHFASAGCYAARIERA